MLFSGVSRTVGSATLVGRLLGKLSTGAFTILYALDLWRLPRLAPKDELQGRHAGRKLSRSSLPPSETANI